MGWFFKDAVDDDTTDNDTDKHTHQWKLVGKTYAPATMRTINGSLTNDALLKLTMGCTTYLWECSDPICDTTRKEECLGREIKQ